MIEAWNLSVWKRANLAIPHLLGKNVQKKVDQWRKRTIDAKCLFGSIFMALQSLNSCPSVFRMIETLEAFSNHVENMWCNTGNPYNQLRFGNKDAFVLTRINMLRSSSKPLTDHARKVIELSICCGAPFGPSTTRWLQSVLRTAAQSDGHLLVGTQF
jgi:hypothetical protein